MIFYVKISSPRPVFSLQREALDNAAIKTHKMMKVSYMFDTKLQVIDRIIDIKKRENFLL